MSNNDDYRMYLEEKFKHINDILQRIEAQTTKTNGRVDKLEIYRDQHPVNCPLNRRVETIEKDLTEYSLIKKYPKLAIILLLFFAFSIYTQVREFIQFDKPKTEITDKK